MNKKIKITDIPADKSIEDFPSDMEFVLNDEDPMLDDSYWDDEDKE